MGNVQALLNLLQIDFQSRLTVGVFDPSFYTADILQLNATEYAYLVVVNAKQSGKILGIFHNTYRVIIGIEKWS